MAFTVYVLRSLRNGRRYTGFTSRSMEERLAEHNRGFGPGWTARNGPFVVEHVEEYPSEIEARQRERFLKTGQGREWLRRRVPAHPAEAGGDS